MGRLTGLPGEVATTFSLPLIAQPCHCIEGPWIVIRGDECIRCGHHPQVRLSVREREAEARWQRQRAHAEALERRAVLRGGLEWAA